jgi:hypothetical protein
MTIAMQPSPGIRRGGTKESLAFGILELNAVQGKLAGHQSK